MAWDVGFERPLEPKADGVIGRCACCGGEIYEDGDKDGLYCFDGEYVDEECLGDYFKEYRVAA